MRSCIGELRITSKQAKLLKVKARTQISPQLERCCLLVSANESYERSSKNIQELTGIKVGHSTQQLLVQRYDFPEVKLAEEVEEMSLDGCEYYNTHRRFLWNYGIGFHPNKSISSHIVFRNFLDAFLIVEIDKLAQTLCSGYLP